MKPTDATLRGIEDHFDLQEANFKVTRQRETDSPAFIFQTGVAEGYHQASVYVANTRKLVATLEEPQSFPLDALELNADLAETLRFAIFHDFSRAAVEPEEEKLYAALEATDMRTAVYMLAMNWIRDEYRSWVEDEMPKDHSFVHLVRLLKEFVSR